MRYSHRGTTPECVCGRLSLFQSYPSSRPASSTFSWNPGKNSSPFLMASLSFSHTRVFFSQLLSLLLYLDPSSTFHSASEGLARMFRPHTALEGAARGGVIPRFAFSIPPASRKQRHRLYIQYPPNGKGSRIRHGCLRAGHLCSPLVSQSAYPRHTGKTATGSSKSRIDSKRGSYDSPTASGQSQVQEWRCACGGQLAPGGRRRSWPSRR